MFRKKQEEILEAFQGLLREFIDFCERNGMEIPERGTYMRILSRSIDLLESQDSPKPNSFGNNPDTEQNQK